MSMVRRLSHTATIAALFLSLVAAGFTVEALASETDDHHDGHHDHHKCVCEARELGLSISCTPLQMMLVEGAIEYLTNSTNDCMSHNKCPGHFLILQAHHDFCAHDVLPTEAEKIIHDFEMHYEQCEIPRQYDPTLTNCPSVRCNDPTLFTNAVSILENNNCNTSCTSQVCTNAIRTILMGHDTCDEDDLPSIAEKALHDYEESCEDQLCNSRTTFYDPSKESCPGDVVKASAKSDDDEVKLDVLIGVVCAVGALVLGLVGFVTYMANRERKGKPIFTALV